MIIIKTRNNNIYAYKVRSSRAIKNTDKMPASSSRTTHKMHRILSHMTSTAKTDDTVPYISAVETAVSNHS